MQPYILGVDIGTGSTKSIAVNFNGQPFSVVQKHYATLHPSPGYSEQDPEVIWNAFIECVQTHVQKLKHQPYAVSLSSAMHSVIPVDAEGKALSNMITWADGRSAEIAERIRASKEGQNIYRSTGTPIHAMSPLCKITWIRENKRELFEATYRFVSIKEFIWFRLFNEFKADHSIASATGLFDIEKREWFAPALEIAGITVDKLSEPVNTSYSCTLESETVITLLGLEPHLPFIIGASDGCLANLGSFAMNEETAAITVGTSGAVRVASNTPVYNWEAMTFNYRLDENTFVCGGGTNNGGNVLQWFLRTFTANGTVTSGDYVALFDEIEKVKAGSEGLIFLPYLNGERAPIWDTKSCGTFFGVRPHHIKPNFSRAVVEGICFSLNTVLETLEDGAHSIRQLNVSGGFVLSRTWMQILADITGKKIAVLQTEDASAIGAAYLAMKALGVIENYESLEKGAGLSVIEPSVASVTVYKTYFSIFKTLYACLKEPMRQLHDI